MVVHATEIQIIRFWHAKKAVGDLLIVLAWNFVMDACFIESLSNISSTFGLEIVASGSNQRN